MYGRKAACQICGKSPKESDPECALERNDERNGSYPDIIIFLFFKSSCPAIWHTTLETF